MNEYIKSPLNYVGGKYKLLPQIIPYFPAEIDTFIDLLGGGFNVGINVRANTVIYNDINLKVVQILEYLNDNDTDICLSEIDTYINQYNLSKTNKEGYIKFRSDYNANPNPIMLYTLICYAFNYQIRYNSKGEFNMPFGENRSSFNPVLREKFKTFCNAIHTRNCKFTNKDFREYNNANLCNCFVYCDPPYFNSTATYNESGGWTEQDELDLLTLLDDLNDRNIRWALSNNLKYDNPLLDKWKDKYNVNYLNGDYSNCNYHKKDKSQDIEVLITNY